MKTTGMVLAALFAALMAIGANLGNFIPSVVVPLTFQTFFAILAGALLGSRLGPLSMTLYTIIGLVGAPVFAQFGGGFGTLLKPTFGFILSFIILAYVTGKIIESSAKPRFGHFLLASFIGLIINYLFGTTYMYLALNNWAGHAGLMTYSAAWITMIPFLIKDLIFSVIAAVLSNRIYGRIQLSRKTTKQKIA